MADPQGSSQRDIGLASQQSSPPNPLQDLNTLLESLEDGEWSAVCALLKLQQGPARSRTKMLAWLYVKCTSEIEGRVSNIRAVYGLCLRLLEDQEIPWYHLELISKALEYRMYNIIGQANDFKRAIGSPLDDFPWCEEIDVYQKQNQLLEDKRARYGTIFTLINAKNVALFDRPIEGASWEFTRGTRYLALAFVHLGWSIEVVEQTLVSLAEHKAANDPEKNAVISLKPDRRSTLERHLTEIVNGL